MGKYNFTEITFVDCTLVSLCRPSLKQSWRKLSLIGTRQRNSQKCSPSKVSRYTVYPSLPFGVIDITFKQLPSLFSKLLYQRRLLILKILYISFPDQYSALMALCAGKKESKGRVETARVLINRGAVVNSHDR